MLQVTVPPGAASGSFLQVQAPDGRLIQTQVPVGMAAGATFAIAMPTAVLPVAVPKPAAALPVATPTSAAIPQVAVAPTPPTATPLDQPSTTTVQDELPPLKPTKSWKRPTPGQKWPIEPRKSGRTEVIAIIILVCFFSLKPIVDAIDAIVALKEPCCASLLDNVSTCPTATDGGAGCCADVDTCVANDACLSTCVFDALGFSLAQFAPGPAGAVLEVGCFIAVVVALVICGIIGRAVDRKYAPKHETLTCAGVHPLLCPLSFLIPPFVTFFCVTIAANVGVQLVMDAAQLVLLVALAVPITLLCAPLACCAAAPSFRFVRHVQIDEQRRQLETVLAGLSAASLCHGPEARDARDTLGFYLMASANLLRKPTPTRWLTFVKALAAVLFFSAWPALIGLMWFMVRLFAAATLCFLHPLEFWKEYGHAVRQRKRVAMMAYPQFWASEAYQRYAAEVGEGKSASALAIVDAKEHAQAVAEEQLEAATEAGGAIAQVAESGASAMVEEEGSAAGKAEAAAVGAASTAGALVTSELAGLLWEGAPMPPILENLLPVVCDMVRETLFLVIFVVKAAGLAESALQAHEAMGAKKSNKGGKQ